jgi:hypothetical protein
MADISDVQIDAAVERGKLALETEPRAASARYNRKLDRVVVDLTNGCTSLRVWRRRRTSS